MELANNVTRLARQLTLSDVNGVARPVKVAFLEPYYGGSHAYFMDAVVAHSRHRFTPVTLPARKWKWRMRAAAVWFARDAKEWIDEEPAIDKQSQTMFGLNMAIAKSPRS